MDPEEDAPVRYSAAEDWESVASVPYPTRDLPPPPDPSDDGYAGLLAQLSRAR